MEEYQDDFIDRKVEEVRQGRFDHRFDDAFDIYFFMVQPRTVPYGWHPYPAKGAENDYTGVA